jgi:hypothetical protein
VSRFVPVAVGDAVRLRKPHPCGGYAWQVTRIGADIGLRCLTCDHRVLLDRETFERRVVAVNDQPPPPASVPNNPPPPGS